MSDRLTEEREGCPYASFSGWGRAGDARVRIFEPDPGFDDGFHARLGSEGFFGFDAARGPLARGWVPARDDLESPVPRKLDVGVGGRIRLELVVSALAAL